MTTETSAEAPPRALELIGVQHRDGQKPMVYVRRPGDDLSAATAVPLKLAGSSKASALEDFLLDSGFVAAVNTKSPKAIAAELREFAMSTPVRVLDSEGVHTFEHSGQSCTVVAGRGNAYWLTDKPADAEIVLVGKAAKRVRPTGSHTDFRVAFSKLLRLCPRFLAVLIFAMAAPMAGEFGIAALALGLFGMTSSGKTLTQHAVSLLVYGEDRVRHFDGTPQGMIEFLQAQGATSVFFEDAQGATSSEALIAILMAAGNSAEGRLRSGLVRQAVAEVPIRAWIIWSAEASLADTVRAGGGVLRSGLYARALEMQLGKHGMFDDLCGHDSIADLFSYVAQHSERCAGVVGDAFAQALSSNWAELKRLWESKRSGVRAAILREAGIPEPDGPTNRLLESLTFVGFVGAAASFYKVLPVKRQHVYASLGLLLKEQADRLKRASTPVAQQVFDAVRDFIRTNLGRFLPIERAGDATPVSGIAGYAKDSKGATLFLFIPSEFRRVVSRFGEEAYTHLRAAGHLITQANRGNQYQARVRLPGQEQPKVQDFVAIADSILAAES